MSEFINIKVMTDTAIAYLKKNAEYIYNVSQTYQNKTMAKECFYLCSVSIFSSFAEYRRHCQNHSYIFCIFISFRFSLYNQ